MRILISGSKFLLQEKSFDEYTQLVGAAAGMIVARAKDILGDTSETDIQVNVVRLERVAAQYIVRDGTFLVAPDGGSHLTIEIDHIDDLTGSAIHEDFLCFVVIAMAVTCFPEWLMKNANCWSKRYGGEKTGWHAGEVAADTAMCVQQNVARFAAGYLCYKQAVLTCEHEYQKKVA